MENYARQNFLEDHIEMCDGLQTRTIILDRNLNILHKNDKFVNEFIEKFNLSALDANFFNSFPFFEELKGNIVQKFIVHDKNVTEIRAEFLVGRENKWEKVIIEPKLFKSQVELVYFSIVSKTSQVEQEQLLEDLKHANDATHTALEEAHTAIEDKEAINEKLLEKNEQLITANETLLDIQNKFAETNDDLLSANKEFSKINESLRTFFRVLSHDLKSALNGISGFTHLLLTENYSVEKQQVLLKMIESCGMKAINIINDLSEWNRAHSGILKPQLMPVYLKLTISDTITGSLPMAAQKAIALHADEQDIVIHSDASIIRRILDNLIANAIKFTSENGTISLSTEKTNNDIIICVQDNGVGMTQGKINNLFKIEKVECISSLGTNDEMGTGLGLLLCQELIGLLHGRIWCESELGIGTRFYLAIPKHSSLN